MDKRLGNRECVRSHIIMMLKRFLFVVIAGAGPAQAAQSTEVFGTFQLKVSNDYLSLQADQAPLAQILQEIAKQAKITIDSNIGPEETVTVRLDRVPLEDGIRQLTKNISVFYTQDARTNTRRIARVVVLSEAKGPTGQTKAASQPEKVDEPAAKPAKTTKPQQQPEPFKFDFDPRKFAEKPKPGK
jgi:hypothetical protein